MRCAFRGCALDQHQSNEPDYCVTNDVENQTEKTPLGDGRRLGILYLLAFLSTITYGLITWQSAKFELSQPQIDRPIILVLGLFGLAFLYYIIASGVASTIRSSQKLTWAIVGPAIVFRVVGLFSTPIQEVDLYRYIWDGVVVSQGISPFKYPPDQVRMADPAITADPELRKLARVRNQDPAIAKVLGHVHFGQLPTVYPATSQAVFGLAAIVTPPDSSFDTRVRIMKTCLLAFDVGILFLVIGLLKLSNLPIGLSVMYGWCPLVWKEVANSGHLDTIAAFFTTLAVYLLVRLLCSKRNDTQTKSGSIIPLSIAALVLAAAVGAKLYPVVLAPLFLVVSIKKFNWPPVLLAGIVFTSATIALLWPMLPSSTQPEDATNIAAATEPVANDPSLGMKTFLKQWEMNDSFFLVAVENLKPAETFPENDKVWFSILPDQYRVTISETFVSLLGITEREAPFMVTRIATSAIFILIALWLAWKAGKNLSKSNDPAAEIGKSAFLTLAWFWLLSPTQNPWYWIWALPFLPFVRNRAWIAVSGLVLIYYMRFWLGYHYYDKTVFETNYYGTEYFDFVVTWFEFAPWLVWLAGESVYRSIRNRTKTKSD